MPDLKEFIELLTQSGASASILTRQKISQFARAGAVNAEVLLQSPEEIETWMSGRFPGFFHRKGANNIYESGVPSLYRTSNSEHEPIPVIERKYRKKYPQNNNPPIVKIEPVIGYGKTPEVSLRTVFAQVEKIANSRNNHVVFLMQYESRNGQNESIIQPGKHYLSVADGPLHDHDHPLIINFNCVTV